MSLSSFLLGKRHSTKDKVIDEDLNDLFRSSVCHFPNTNPTRCFNRVSCVQISTPETKTSPVPTKIGAKRAGDAVEDAFPALSKRKKSVNEKAPPSVQPIPSTNASASRSKRTKEEKSHKVSKKSAKTEKTSEETGDEDHAGLEAYEHKVHPGKQATKDSSRGEGQLNDTSDSEGDSSQLVHETMAKKAQRDKTRPRHVYHVPPDETKEQRDARTIFLGNVPVEVAKSKVCPLSFLSWPLFSPIISLPRKPSRNIYYHTSQGPK